MINCCDISLRRANQFLLASSLGLFINVNSVSAKEVNLLTGEGIQKQIITCSQSVSYESDNASKNLANCLITAVSDCLVQNSETASECTYLFLKQIRSMNRSFSFESNDQSFVDEHKHAFEDCYASATSEVQVCDLFAEMAIYIDSLLITNNEKYLGVDYD